jgi:hypothetical protein
VARGALEEPCREQAERYPSDQKELGLPAREVLRLVNQLIHVVTAEVTCQTLQPLGGLISVVGGGLLTLLA